MRIFSKVLGLLGLAYLMPAWGLVWKSTAHGQVDNEDLITTSGVTVGVSGLESRWGTFDLYGEFLQSQIEKNRLGLRARSDQVPGFRSRYALMFEQCVMIMQGGVASLSGAADPTLDAELSRYWLAGSLGVLRLKLSYLSQVDKNSPMLTALALRSQTLAAALNLSAGSWFFELSSSGKFIAGADNATTDKLLRDTSQFNGLQNNRIGNAYFYGYRTIRKWLLAGAFTSFADSRHDFYAFLYRSQPNKIDTYMYFPYATPLNAFAWGGVFAGNLDLESYRVPLGAFSAKITFPFYSRHEQFYQIRSNFGIPMYQGYYVFHGGETWTGDLAWSKKLPHGMGLNLAYRYSMKPYLEYGFFKEQGYRVHALEISITKS